MRVKIVAHTLFLEQNAKEFGYIPHWEYLKIDELVDDPTFTDEDWWDLEARLPKGIDELAEFAGRNCYQSWERPNPETATNEGYIRNILNQKHFSVLEHGTVTFAIDGVSTALLGQLSRHRHFSFSVLSARFVDKSKSKMVVHPTLAELMDESVYPEHYEYPYPVKDVLQDVLDECIDQYERLVTLLIEKKGLSRKKAREAARTVLPQGIETCIVLTGNMRAFREFLEKRLGEGADEEIKAFAKEVLQLLKEIAPNSFQDLEV